MLRRVQVRNVIGERKALAAMDHNMVLRQYGTWQDRDQVYIFTELVQGGELWGLLYREREKPDPHVKFTACGAGRGGMWRGGVGRWMGAAQDRDGIP